MTIPTHFSSINELFLLFRYVGGIAESPATPIAFLVNSKSELLEKLELNFDIKGGM